MFLYEQYCDTKNSPALLSDEQIKLYLKEIPKWEADLDKKEILRDFKFKDYYQTLLFINAIAKIVHNENHHPNINFGYNHCKINYSTHSANGITLFDLICAAKIDRVFSKQEFKE